VTQQDSPGKAVTTTVGEYLADLAATATAPDIDIKALIRGSKRATKTVPICMRGDLVAEFEALEADLTKVAANVVDSRLNGAKAQGRKLAEQMAVLQEEMRGSTVPFILRALGRSRWAALLAEHPPRMGADGKVLADDTGGFNAATLWTPLIRASVISPLLDDDDWAVLLMTNEDGTDGDDNGGGLSNGQFDALGTAAWRLNQSLVDIPFSRAALAILRSIGVE
jgi:hypothetical protein